MRSRSCPVLFALAMFAACSGCSPLTFGKPDFEFTGTVYDNVTKQPIEGAYVFASYHEELGVNSRCYKTRGMYTGKDGKYHFPIERNDGLSPVLTSAVKPGYYRGPWNTPTPEVWRRQDASSYADRNLYLIPQDPAKPSYFIGSGEEFCTGAHTREDAAAGAQFLRLELAELVKYGAPEQVTDATKRMIRRLETIGKTGEGAARSQQPR